MTDRPERSAESALSIKWGSDGLVPVVVQDRLSGEIRMVAWANERALQKTIESKLGHFYSRSRQSLWQKGETSGHVLHVHEIWTDCDSDALIYLVESEGPSCHTGKETCFFENVESASNPSSRALPALAKLTETLEARAKASASKSYTRSLLDGGAAAITAKIVEEAGELSTALQSESDERIVSEAADVLYHLMVGLLSRGKSIRDVERLLMSRFGVSGHDEKNSRKS